MLLSIQWLQEFTPFKGSLEELAQTLTMLGLEVEEQYNPFSHLQGFLVGYVQECHPHPKADKLTLCRVEIGQDHPVDIICGAPNVAPGQLVPVAPVGSVLPSGQKVRKSKIRDVLSSGLICSEKELELSDDHSGIMTLEQGYPGQELVQALNLETSVFDIGITPNRADCLSILGIAREVAAYFDLPIYLPSTPLQEGEKYCDSLISLDIQAPEGCFLYQTRIIKNIKLGPSPDWMRYRLLALGLRPINNIVDITNYVLLELGQPQHAFDYNLLADQCIKVNRAEPDQQFTTLDNQVRSLDENDLLISDGQKPVALAGIMGGANTEIQPETRDVLLECAIFNPAFIQRTSRKLGLSSESSYRFERGVDHPGSELALNRAASLVQRLAGGQLARGITKEEPQPWTPHQVKFRPEKAKNFLFLDVDQEFSHKTLENLGCQIQRSSNQTWAVIPPSFRLDLSREEDLIEEVGRVYGFEHIPARVPNISRSLPRATSTSETGQASYSFLKQIKTWAQGLGFKEAINYSFVGYQEIKNLGLANQDLIFVKNPLTLEQDTLRPALAPGLLQNLRLNIDQDNRDIRFFEVARTYLQDDQSDTKAREKNILGLILHGRRTPNFWPWSGQKCDYLEIKGVVEHCLDNFQLSQMRFDLLQEHPFLNPAVKVTVSGIDIGFLGQLKEELHSIYHVRNAVWLAELNLDALFKLYRQTKIEYRSWPKFPPVLRDITLIAGPEIKFREIQEVIFQTKIAILEQVNLLDIYQPENSEERNITLRLTYRHPQKTLTDKEVDKKHSELGQTLIKTLPLRFP